MTTSFTNAESSDCTTVSICPEMRGFRLAISTTVPKPALVANAQITHKNTGTVETPGILKDAIVETSVNGMGTKDPAMPIEQQMADNGTERKWK